MADPKTKTEAPDEAVIPTPEMPAVTAQEAKVVDGDGAEPMVVTPQIVIEQVAAQVSPPREGDSDKVNVHEVFVATDRIITDPSSPLAVQIPAEGRGDASLPIHALSGGGVEAKFDKANKDAAAKK
jgi:hypothetical protein